jgi:hypothetical protein
LRPCWLDNGITGDTYGVPRATVCYRDQPPGPFPAEFDCGMRPVTAVTIDLGASRPIAEVRGAYCDRCFVDVSVNGRTWSEPMPTSRDVNAVIQLPDGTAGRYVRLRAAPPAVGSLDPEFEATGPIVGPVLADVTPNDLALQPELSVWAPRPAPLPTPADSPTAADSPAPRSSPSAAAKHEGNDATSIALDAVAAIRRREKCPRVLRKHLPAR